MLRRGRFEKSMDSDAAEYSASLDDDVRLFEAVVQINIAHIRMLAEKGIIDESDADQILDALTDLGKEGLEALELTPELEDIHMVVEEYVEDRVGEETAGKLHTAKSRNDQVAAAIRMVLREDILEIQEEALGLVEEILDLAEDHKETVMPGYTHLQVAEPTTFAHYLNSYVQAFVRDLESLKLSYEQTNLNPLGACALSGTSFPIDRDAMRVSLGFDGILENTIDATGSRDFALRVMSNLSILMSNLSSFAEELVLWSTAEFDMLDIPEEFSSTSSIMPQKKNPVTAELGRAKSGRVMGDLVGAMSIMKALPQAYNLDLQELTPLLWDSVDQTKSSLRVMKKLVSGLEPKPGNMREGAERGFATLTELANTLVRGAGIPFRKAHSIVGQMAALALEDEKYLEDLSPGDLQEAAEKAIGEKIEISDDEFDEALTLDTCVEKRDVTGGPSPRSVAEELSGLKNKVENYNTMLGQRRAALSKAREDLMDF